MAEYPAAQRSQTVELFNSTTTDCNSRRLVSVANPYDWLEDNLRDDTREFVAAQNESLDSYLSLHDSAAPTQDYLMHLVHSMVQGEIIAQPPQLAGHYYLVRVSGCGRPFPVTLKIDKQDLRRYLRSCDAKDLHPSTQIPPPVFHDEGDEGSTLLSTGISRNGRYWAYCTSVQGSDWGLIRVKEIETGRVLPDQVHNTKFNNTIKSISWWGDAGFFYQYWQTNSEQSKRPQLRFHALGTQQADDKVIYEDPIHPYYCFWFQISEDGKFGFLSLYSAGQTSEVRVCRMGQPEQQARFDFDIAVCNNFDYQWEYIGQLTHKQQAVYAFYTNRNNGEIIGVSFDSAQPSRVLLLNGCETYTLKLAKAIGHDRILLIRSIDVRDKLQLVNTDSGELITVDCPIDSVLRVDYNPESQDIFIIESSFSKPFSLWHIDGGGFSPSQTNAPKPVAFYPEFQTNAVGISTKQVFYSSSDATRIPMFIVSDDTHAISKDTPVLLYVYGGFGISLIPHFRPDLLAFIKAFRGIVAFANIRGGGEYGRDWYLAACGEKRQTALDDIHGALQHLIGTMATARKPILMGESMGALNSMSAIIQRPDLVSAGVLNAGPFDILHREKGGLGLRGMQDIGDEKIPSEFAAMYKWSPLENARVGHRYPPALFTAGDRDDLVKYSNSCKMVATLQHTQQKLDKPPALHLRISENLGHGGAISAVKAARIGVERLHWLKTTLGLTLYKE